MGEFILYETDGAVATITINRPKQLNALNNVDFEQVISKIQNPNIKAIIENMRI